MQSIDVKPGQKPVVLVLQRPLFPQDGFVTHKITGPGGEVVWHADLVQTGQRWTTESKKKLLDKFTFELLNKDYMVKNKAAGRPKSMPSKPL
jgi:hypothetical protein